MAKSKGLQIIQNEQVDLEKIHPSLRYLYGNGMPMRTYKTEAGATVRYFGSLLPETDEEQAQRVDAAFEVADRIRTSAAGRRAAFAT